MHAIPSSLCAIYVIAVLALPMHGIAQERADSVAAGSQHRQANETAKQISADERSRSFIDQPPVNFAREPWEPSSKAFSQTRVAIPYTPAVRTKHVYPAHNRQAVVKKLQTIRIEEFHIPQALEITEVIKRVHILARKSDPDNVGINLILSPRMEYSRLVPAIHPATGAPRLAVGDYLVTINPPLRDLNLHAVLQAVVDAAKPPKDFENAPPLRFSIEDYAVVIGQRTIEREQLHTRTYKVDPNTFLQGLNLDFEPEPLQPVTDPARVARIQEVVRDYFQRAGLNLSTNQIPAAPGFPASPQKAIFFNDRTGTLMIRATLNDLQIVEKALQTLNATPKN